MSRITDLIAALKERKEQLEKIKKEQEIRRLNNDAGQFYEDSLNISNMTTGMVIIITPDDEIREFVPSNMSHKKTCQEIFASIGDDRVDFDNCEGDFGDAIAEEYNSIFIRMASVLNGSTIIYFPKNCNDYQIERLEQFNKEVRDYNSRHNNEQLVSFEYNGKDDKTTYDIGPIIDYLKKNKVGEYK